MFFESKYFISRTLSDFLILSATIFGSSMACEKSAKKTQYASSFCTMCCPDSMFTLYLYSISVISASVPGVFFNFMKNSEITPFFILAILNASFG